MTRALFTAALLACASKPPSHVEILPLPSQQTPSATESLDDLACKPSAVTPIEVAELDRALAVARDFAQRCCSGDESGDATVHVTAAPSGYQTQIAIEPEKLSTGATGECLYGTFHRVLVKPFEGGEKSASVIVRLR